MQRVEQTNRKKSSLIFQIAYLYLAIPILIFVFGWFRTPLAIVSALIIGVGLFAAMKDAPKARLPEFRKEDIWKIAVLILIAVLWVFLSGIGGYAFQNDDHRWRNTILKMLVEQSWPVVIEDTAPYLDYPVALIYYFAFWLPSACVGKLLGLGAAHTFLAFWTLIGVLLVFYFILLFYKKAPILVIIAFIYFSGLDVVGRALRAVREAGQEGSFLVEIVRLLSNHSHIEWWARYFQYSAFTTQLFWVFNQALPAWLITLLMLHQENNRSQVFLISFALLHSTLPFIGLIPIMLYLMISRCVKLYDRSVPWQKNLFAWMKDTLTIQNVLTGGLIGITSYLFLKMNTAGGNISVSGGWSASGETGLYYRESYYIRFIFWEFMIYALVIWTNKRKNGLFLVALLSLLIIPPLNGGSDFTMRSSIPALLILFLMVMDVLYEHMAKGKHLKPILLIIILVIGGLNAQREISRSINNTFAHIVNPSHQIFASLIDPIDYSKNTNFFGKCDDTFFFKYIAKPSKE